MCAPPFGRRCSGCRKRRNLRTNSFFEEFPKIALSTLLKTIFFFTQDDPQERIARALNIDKGLVSRICRRLRNVCSRDLQLRPFIPFGGPGAVVKCDESKFNHKSKVTLGFLIVMLRYFVIEGLKGHRVVNDIVHYWL